MDAGLLARIMAKIEKQPDGCWLWRGYMNGDVPFMSIAGDVKINVRRTLYQANIGDPPRNIRMACGNQRCVNPAHVAQPKTHACRAYWECQKCAKSEKPIDRLRWLARRCGFELVPVGKNRWHVVLDMS